MQKETEDTATVTIRPGWGFSGEYQPGQYVGIGLSIDGKWHWRSYSLTSVPVRDKAHLHHGQGHSRGLPVDSLGERCAARNDRSLGVTQGRLRAAGSAAGEDVVSDRGQRITPVMAMLRSMNQRGRPPTSSTSTRPRRRGT